MRQYMQAQTKNPPYNQTLTEIEKELKKAYLNLNPHNYLSVSRLKNSMYCPNYARYILEGHRPARIETPESQEGTRIHQTLDTTPKEEAPPEEAALINSLNLINAALTKETPTLTELPYFSPTRPIWGIPDLITINNGKIQITERKTRTRLYGEEGLPHVFTDDIYQLHIQKKLISDILAAAASYTQIDVVDPSYITTAVEIRLRGENPENNSPQPVKEMQESEIGLTDNYGGESTATIRFGNSVENVLTVYADVDADSVSQRFDKTCEALLSNGKIDGRCLRCPQAKQRYCGFNVICRKRRSNPTLNDFL
ncbi:PD-(D/E)XK nuclease superfamily protein [uncultured archaeon]|nr:PD-(D/E)XK nuclease superfamily protein [uncultured archaeon]